MGIHHIGYVHSDVAQARAFFLAALEPLGYKEIYNIHDQVYGLGIDKKPDFWVSSGKHPNGEAPDKAVTTGVHIAFTAPSRDIVDQCYAAAIKAGGKCNGPPGLRPQYTPTYYGAYFFDAAGNNIEVVHMGEMPAEACSA